MASKTVIDAPRANMFMVEPEALVLVTDTNHPLYDPRVHLPLDENLVLNIKVHGVKEPVLVRKNGDAFEVVDGRQRTRAAVEANRRLRAEGCETMRIRTIIERGDDSTLAGIMVMTNELRKDDTPLAKAEKARRLLDMGKSEQEVGVIFGLTRQSVRSLLALLDLATPVRNAVEKGELSATAAAKLAPLSHGEQKKSLDAMREQGGRMTAARTEKVTKGESAAPARRMRSRAKIEECLAKNVRDDEFGRGFSAALRWVLGEECQ